MNSNARCSGEARRQDRRDPGWESSTCVPFVHPLNFLYAGTSYATISNAVYQADFVRSVAKIVHKFIFLQNFLNRLPTFTPQCRA